MHQEIREKDVKKDTSFEHEAGPFEFTPFRVRSTIAQDSLLIKKQDQVSDWDILTL